MVEKEKASASTLAIKRTTYGEAYLKAALLSSLKEQIGQLLLYLQISSKADRQVYWQHFETSLQEYIDLILNEMQL